MAIMPDSSPYGSQTVTGPGWPNVDEETLAAAAASYEALAAKLSGSVVPQQQGQLMKLTDSWEGGGSLAAAGEASTIIGGHEANAAQATAIAAKLRSMEAAVVQTKTLVNAAAQETQQECEALQALPVSNTQELVQSRIQLGLSQNIASVTGNTTELANTIGVPPSIPTAAGAPPPAGAQQAAGQDSQQSMQMMGQMVQMAAQIPQQIGQLLGQGTQQLTQPLQQLTQPLQQLTSMFGSGGSSNAAAKAASPFSAFSKHPLAGGSGAGGGSGMVRAASLPGSGGVASRTPLMSALMGSHPAGAAPAEAVGAGTAAIGGVAPVAASGGMGGMGGMMGGHRGTSGGTTGSLSAPPPLEYDLGEDDADDDW
jgi:hypothetical protein